jgi:glucose/mannose-6-phosphate isomerase
LLVTRGTLDDPETVERIDRSGMLSVAAGLGGQLMAGWEAGAFQLEARAPHHSDFESVVVCGMGGSGIAGDVVRSLYGPSLPVPVTVVKGFELPPLGPSVQSGGRGALVIAVSYSGNTEETLVAYEQARERGREVIGVSAGGELAARAERHGGLHISVPAEVPMPRAAIGYLAGAIIGLFDAIQFTSGERHDVETTAAFLDDLQGRLGPGRPIAENESKELALWLAGRTPVVWGSEGLGEAAALRWKNQLNENAKVPAFSSTLPELSHNEVEGWSSGTGVSFGLLALRHPGEHPRLTARIEAALQAVQDSGLGTREVWAEGSTPMQRLFSLMMKADFTSVYVAVLRGIDPTPVPVLTGQKERLRP